mmetsp:Transcript_14028/g.34040  ORF Transcript_14028/g.34040 Transcript_14028/m.34040 type:complete len:505 (+) Transcript_14028:125-1639(+)
MKLFYLLAGAAAARVSLFDKASGAVAAEAGISADPARELVGDDGDDFLRVQMVILRDIAFFENQKGGTSALQKTLRSELANVTGEAADRFNMLDVRGRYTKAESLLVTGLRPKPKRAKNHGPGIAEAETFVDFEINEGEKGHPTSKQVVKDVRAALDSGKVGTDLKMPGAFKDASVDLGPAPSDEEVADSTADFPALPAHMPTCAEFKDSEPICRANRQGSECRATGFMKKVKTECSNVASDEAGCRYAIRQSYANCCDSSYRKQQKHLSEGQCYTRTAVIAALPSCEEYQTRADKNSTFQKKVKAGCGQYEADTQNRCARQVSEIYAYCERKNGCNVSPKTNRDPKFVDCTLERLGKRDAVNDDTKEKDDESNPFAIEGMPTFAPGSADWTKDLDKQKPPSSPEDMNPYDEEKGEWKWAILIIDLLILLCCCGCGVGAYLYFRGSGDKPQDPNGRVYTPAPVSGGGRPSAERAPTVTTYYESDRARQYDPQAGYQPGTAQPAQ